MQNRERAGDPQTPIRSPGKSAGQRGLECGSDCVFRLRTFDSVDAPGVASEFRIWCEVSMGATVAIAVSPEGFHAFCGAGRTHTGQENK